MVLTLWLPRLGGHCMRQISDPKIEQQLFVASCRCQVGRYATTLCQQYGPHSILAILRQLTTSGVKGNSDFGRK